MTIDTDAKEDGARAPAPCAVRERIRARRGLALEPDDALFLDFDGTLVDIAGTPEAVRVPAGLAPLLGAVAGALDGALGLLTGRTIADVDRLLTPLRTTVAGVHGGELRLLPSDLVHRPVEPIDEEIVDRLRRVVSDLDGVRIETKGTSVAVHWRATPRSSGAIEARLQSFVAGEREPLALMRGRRVFEVTRHGVSKGNALADFAVHPPFVGRRPVMIGDDVSDESAFATVERMGGVGLRVAGEHFGSEHADFAAPEEVRAWLTDLLRRTRR